MLNTKNLFKLLGVALVVTTTVVAASAIVKPGHCKKEIKSANIVKPGH